MCSKTAIPDSSTACWKSSPFVKPNNFISIFHRVFSQWVFSHIFPSFLCIYICLACSSIVELHCCYDEWVKIKAILNCLFIRSCCFEPQKHFGCQSYYCEVVHQNQSVWSCHRQSAIMTLLFRFSSTLPTYTYTLGSIVCWLLPSIQYGKSIGTVFYQYLLEFF